ncbi:MAG: methylated-DNA--[protein]-cysteine S-methyltransferase [Rhodothermales bacterium]|nr:methylated-DNA--[protein]-cysteine S-methyltransferase [Rhodothermales bacterium]
MLVYTVAASPVGPLTLVASAQGLRAVRFGAHAPRGASEDAAHPALARAAGQLAEYFAGTRTAFDLALDLEGTPFQQRVWALLQTIPYGATTTYGALAARLGDPRTVRAVGRANGQNPAAVVVPCHRVVGQDGSLTGFAGGLEAKALLLRLERRVRPAAGGPAGQGDLFGPPGPAASAT